MKNIENVLLLLLGIVGLYCALWIDEPAFVLQKDYLGTAGYPQIIGTGLAMLCVLTIVRNYLQRKSTETYSLELQHIGKPVLLAIAYVVGIAYVGFVACTFVYLLFMPALIDRADVRVNIWKHGFYAVTITVVMQCFFSTFKIYLPTTIFI